MDENNPESGHDSVVIQLRRSRRSRRSTLTNEQYHHMLRMIDIEGAASDAEDSDYVQPSSESESESDCSDKSDDEA